MRAWKTFPRAPSDPAGGRRRSLPLFRLLSSPSMPAFLTPFQARGILDSRWASRWASQPDLPEPSSTSTSSSLLPAGASPLGRGAASRAEEDARRELGKAVAEGRGLVRRLKLEQEAAAASLSSSSSEAAEGEVRKELRERAHVPVPLFFFLRRLFSLTVPGGGLRRKNEAAVLPHHRSLILSPPSLPHRPPFVRPSSLFFSRSGPLCSRRPRFPRRWPRLSSRLDSCRCLPRARALSLSLIPIHALLLHSLLLRLLFRLAAGRDRARPLFRPPADVGA